MSSMRIMKISLRRGTIIIGLLVLMLVMLGLSGCGAPPLDEEPVTEEATAEQEDQASDEQPVEEEVEEEPAEEPAGEEAAESVVPEITELPLHFQPGDVAFAPQAIALGKGWFEEAGFTEVNTVNFTAGALAGEALLAEEIFMWTPGNVPVIAMRHNGIPVVVLGNVAKTFPETLVVGPDSGIENGEDLVGKRVALLEGSTASAVLNNIATHYGLDVNEIEVVNLPPPEQVTALCNGEVDAMINFFRFNFQGVDDCGGTFRVYQNTSFFEGDSGTAIEASHTRTPLVFNEEFVRNNPNTVKALLSVMLRAQEYLLDPGNREEALEIFADVSEIDVETAEIAWDDLIFDPTLDDGYVYDTQQYTDFLVAAGRVTDDPIDPLDYLYTGLLAELAPEYVVTEGNWNP